MATFVLIPGAGGAARFSSRLVGHLEAAGHRAIAVDLPGPDESAGLSEYADLVVQACGDADDVVLVAESLGGFTAPLVCERTTVRALVFVNAMIPVPGEKPDEWSAAVGADAARLAAAEQRGYPAEMDLQTYFLHDMDPDTAAEVEPLQRDEAAIVFGSVCAFERWPDVPIRVLAGADDRLFPVGLQRRVARDRLGIEADVLPGGHLIVLSHAAVVAEYLLAVAP